jgi:hypothetical protein
MTRGGVGWRMGRTRVHGTGFQPLPDWRSDTWGVAPGWFEDAPLALAAASSIVASTRNAVYPNLGVAFNPTHKPRHTLRRIF